MPIVIGFENDGVVHFLDLERKKEDVKQLWHVIVVTVLFFSHYIPLESPVLLYKLAIFYRPRDLLGLNATHTHIHIVIQKFDGHY